MVEDEPWHLSESLCPLSAKAENVNECYLLWRAAVEDSYRHRSHRVSQPLRVNEINHLQWCILMDTVAHLVISVLRRLQQEDSKFNTSLSYMVRQNTHVRTQRGVLT